MPTLILARHGRTTANATAVLAGRSRGVHLDDRGKEQASVASGRLVDLALAAVVTSPMERCRETAQLLAPAQRALTERRLTECDYGEWTGRPLKELSKEPLWRTVQAHPAGVVFPGGEAMADMSRRGVAAVRDWDARIASEHGSEAVWLAVSHGDVIKAILADALGMHLDTFQRIVVDPGSLSLVRYTELRPFVLAVNTSAGSLGHLKSPPARRRRSRKTAAGTTGDAVLGGGAGPGTT
ncbi:MAG: MSMEG_4193 family putative phosphomutase [Actinomycetota bacterium]|nr:MSMEG_4193 family putative phosphomutase [Actinomycetota bacterium]